MDRLTPEERKENMRRIRDRNSRPELIVRQMLFRQGYRYRINYKKLPGKPDIVFPGRKLAIFVHGCFWHLHPECAEGRVPSSNVEYWRHKLQRNVERDQQNLIQLREMGWRTEVIWECETKKPLRLEARLQTIFQEIALKSEKVAEKQANYELPSS